MTGIFAAIGAAISWTVASYFWENLSNEMKAIQLNGIKNMIALILFIPLILTIPWVDKQAEVGILLVSGVLGISCGDSFYMAALARLGTRRTLTVEAVGPVLASICSVYLMKEPLKFTSWCGAILMGISLIMVAKDKSDKIINKGREYQGLIYGFMAVICGIGGAFLTRFVLKESDITPSQSAAIRLFGGFIGLLPFLNLRSISGKMEKSKFIRILLATIIGTNVGLVLQQIAFLKLPLGTGITLLNTSPIIALFFYKLEGNYLKREGILSAFLAFASVGLTSL